MRAIGSVLLATSLFAAGTSLGASECPTEGREYIRLVFEPEDGADGCSEVVRPLRDRIARLIQANLQSEQVDVCRRPADVYRLPLATLEISLPCEGASQARIVVSDAVTDKQVSRPIPLSGLPADTHAMAVAIGAVELLRASWAETRLNGSSIGRGSYPEAVGAVLDQRPKESKLQSSAAVSLAGETFRGGLQLLGVEAEFAWSVHRHVELLAHLGGRRARTERSLHGEVTANVWLTGLGASYLVLQPSPQLQLRALARVDGAWLDFSPDAKGKAVATARDAATAWAGVGLASAVRCWERSFFTMEALGGWVVWPVVVTDAGKAVTGARGGYVAGRIGLKVYF